jgi:hypothetical protein
VVPRPIFELLLNINQPLHVTLASSLQSHSEILLSVCMRIYPRDVACSLPIKSSKATETGQVTHARCVKLRPDLNVLIKDPRLNV